MRTTKNYQVLCQYNNRGDCGEKVVTVRTEARATALRVARDLICDLLRIDKSVVSVRLVQAPSPFWYVVIQDSCNEPLGFVLIRAKDCETAEARGDRIAADAGHQENVTAIELSLETQRKYKGYPRNTFIIIPRQLESPRPVWPALTHD